MPITWHHELQDQHWPAGGIAGGHVHGQHGRGAGDAEQPGFLGGGMAGDDLLYDVVDADALAPGQMRADPAMQRLRRGQVGALGHRHGNPPGDDLGGLAVAAQQQAPVRDLGLGWGAEQGGDAGRRHAHAGARQLAGLAGLVAVQRLLAGPPRTKLPLPCWVSIHPSWRSTRSARTTVGRAIWNSSLSWCSLGSSEPGGYSPDSMRRRSSSITWAYLGGVYS